MSRKPRFLVLLACYNGHEYINSQLGSILEQNNVLVQVLIRDDGSSDATLAVVKEVASRDPRVRIAHDGTAPMGWPAGNFFHLLKTTDLSEFDYIAFSDQDDLWLPGKLERAATLLAANAADGYSCNLIAFDNAGLVAPHVLDKAQPQRDLDYLFQGGSAGCTYVLSRKVAEQLAGWLRERELRRDMGLSHDWTAYAYVRATGLRWVCDNAALILYRQHGRNEYGARGGLIGLRQRTMGMRSGWYRRHILWLLENLPERPGHQRLRAMLTRLSPVDRVKLTMRAGQFRRSPRQAALLGVAVLMGLFG